MPFSDVESLYSLDDEYSPQALVVMGYSTTEEDSDFESMASDPELQAILYLSAYFSLFGKPHSYCPSSHSP